MNIEYNKHIGYTGCVGYAEYVELSLPLATAVTKVVPNLSSVVPNLSSSPEGQNFHDGFTLGKIRAAELVQKVERNRVLAIKALRKEDSAYRVKPIERDEEMNNVGFNEAIDAVLEVLETII